MASPTADYWGGGQEWEDNDAFAHPHGETGYDLPETLGAYHDPIPITDLIEDIPSYKDERPVGPDSSNELASVRPAQANNTMGTHAAQITRTEGQTLAAAAREESGTDTDEDGQLIQQVAANLEAKKNRALKLPKEPKVKEPKPPKERRASRKAGAVSLKQLIDDGYLLPGPSVLYVEYKGSTTHGDLTEDGKIKYNDQLFESPSAFSIFLKRLVNPTRKADDGWKTVKYENKLLEHYKWEYLEAKVGRDFGEGSPAADIEMAEEMDDAEPPQKRQRVDGGEDDDLDDLLLSAAGVGPGGGAQRRPADEADDEATEDECFQMLTPKPSETDTSECKIKDIQRFMEWMADTGL